MQSCWMKKQIFQKNAFKNQSVFLKDKKDENDLMHVSQKQIPMLETFDMQITYYCYNIICYPIKLYTILFKKYMLMWHHVPS
jgi:hypothetical protein